MNEQVTIRDLVLSEYQTIKRLLAELGYPSSETEVRERLARISSDQSLRTLVAELDREIVGFIGLSKSYGYERNGCFIRITALVVSKEHRKKGIGTKLVQAAEEWARTQRASCILLNSGIKREEAHQFYQNKGYSIKGYSFIKELCKET